MPWCGPKNLYAEQTRKSQPRSCTSVDTCGTDWTASTYVHAPASRAFRLIVLMSLIVPVRLLAPPTQTSLVLSDRRSSSRERSNSNESRSNGNHLISSPKSRANSTHGCTFASWSMRVRMISSPGCICRPIDLDRCSVMVVIFWPKIISSADGALSRSAFAA